jgi:hypothetical protein
MDKEIAFVIKEYKKNLENLGIKAKKIIIFGSYANGVPKKDSDIDMVVISDDFQNLDLWERLCLLGEATLGIKKPMEVLGYTGKEYEEKERGSFIGDEVKARGVEVA